MQNRFNAVSAGNAFSHHYRNVMKFQKKTSPVLSWCLLDSSAAWWRWFINLTAENFLLLKYALIITTFAFCILAELDVKLATLNDEIEPTENTEMSRF